MITYPKTKLLVGETKEVLHEVSGTFSFRLGRRDKILTVPDDAYWEVSRFIFDFPLVEQNRNFNSTWLSVTPQSPYVTVAPFKLPPGDSIDALFKFFDRTTGDLSVSTQLELQTRRIGSAKGFATQAFFKSGVTEYIRRNAINTDRRVEIFTGTHYIRTLVTEFKI